MSKHDEPKGYPNLLGEVQDQILAKEARAQSEGDCSFDDQDSWKKVKARKYKHIELKDLTENDFTSLIEAKNQDKRFYSWLNFQPLF